MLTQEGRRCDRPSLLHRGVSDLVRQAAQADHAERDALEGGGTGLRIGAGEEGGHVDDELVDGVAHPHAEVGGHVRAQDDLVRRVGVRSSALRDERSIAGGSSSANSWKVSASTSGEAPDASAGTAAIPAT